MLYSTLYKSRIFFQKWKIVLNYIGVSSLPKNNTLKQFFMKLNFKTLSCDGYYQYLSK